MWSLGVVLFEILTGEKPERELPDAIAGAPINFPKEVQSKYPFLYSAAQKCLQVDPVKRPTATQLLAEFNKQV